MMTTIPPLSQQRKRRAKSLLHLLLVAASAVAAALLIPSGGNPDDDGAQHRLSFAVEGVEEERSAGGGLSSPRKKKEGNKYVEENIRTDESSRLHSRTRYLEEPTLEGYEINPPFVTETLTPSELAAKSLSFGACRSFEVPPADSDVCRKCHGGDRRRRRVDQVDFSCEEDEAVCESYCRQCEMVEDVALSPRKRFAEFDLCDAPDSATATAESNADSDPYVCEACQLACAGVSIAGGKNTTDWWTTTEEAWDILHENATNVTEKSNAWNYSDGGNVDGNIDRSEREWLCYDCLEARCLPDPSVSGEACERRILSLVDYLVAYVDLLQQEEADYCSYCKDCPEIGGGGRPGADEGAIDGDPEEGEEEADLCCFCADECLKIENMEENGYIDATEFIGCFMIYDPDPVSGKVDGIGSIPLFAGPVCASSGTKIKIGVFLDEFCTRLDPSKDVDDYLMDGDGYQMKLSHSLLRQTYADGAAVSCASEPLRRQRRRRDDLEVGGSSSSDSDGEERRSSEKGRRRADDPVTNPAPICEALYMNSGPTPTHFTEFTVFDADGDHAGDWVEQVEGDGEPTIFVLRASTDFFAFRPDGTAIPRNVRLVYSKDEEEEEAVGGDPPGRSAVEFYFGPWALTEEGTTVGWTLRGSALYGEGDMVGEWTPGDDGDGDGDVADEAVTTMTAAAIELRDENVLFHCESMEFTYTDEDGEEAGIIRLTDVLVGSISVGDVQESAPSCRESIYNPCDAESVASGRQLLCQAVDGVASCVEPGGWWDSPVPGLDRGEYLRAFFCGEFNGSEDGDDGDVYSPPEDDEYYYAPEDPDYDEWEEATLGGPDTDWERFSVFPMRCIRHNDTDMVLFLVSNNIPYVAPCEAVVGTYLAPLSLFINISLPQMEPFPDEKALMFAGCTKVARGSGDATRWFRIGCSDLSDEGLFVNSYSDDACTQDRTTVGVSDLQIPFQSCQSCGPPHYYLTNDDAVWEDADEALDDYYTDVETYSSSLECTDLTPYVEQQCDWWCQDAALARPENETFDLYWKAPNAFLQASDVAAMANGTTYRFEDDLGRPEHIQSGREGEEISREYMWTESGRNRRLKFYFWIKDVLDYPSVELAQEKGWRLNGTRIYSNNGVYDDWLAWSGGENSTIEVPAGKHLFYCDYVEFNFPSGAFTGHHVFIGGFLPYRFDVCALQVHNPCQSVDGTRSICRAINGIVSCADLEQDANSSVPPIMGRSSPSNELHCEKPNKGLSADPETLEWKGPRSYLYAAKAIAGYMDGTAIQFQDSDGREPEIDSGAAGELVARQTNWRDAGNGMERKMWLSFTPVRGSTAADVATWGWVMNETQISRNSYFRTGWHSTTNPGIAAPEKQLFHCEYIEFSYAEGHYYNYDDDPDRSPHGYYNPYRQDETATFVGHDVIIGAYLPKGYDICSLEVFNPCHKEGKVCHAIDGQVSCLDNTKDSSLALMMRSSAVQLVPMCGGDSRGIPAAENSSAPNASPASIAGAGATMEPTVSRAPTPFEPSGAPRSPETVVGMLVVLATSLHFILQTFFG